MTLPVARFKRTNLYEKKKKYFGIVGDSIGMSKSEIVKEKEQKFKTVLLILYPNLRVIKSHSLIQ